MARAARLSSSSSSSSSASPELVDAWLHQLGTTKPAADTTGIGRCGWTAYAGMFVGSVVTAVLLHAFMPLLPVWALATGGAMVSDGSQLL